MYEVWVLYPDGWRKKHISWDETGAHEVFREFAEGGADCVRLLKLVEEYKS